MKSKVDVVAGGQFGSEGKGAVAAHLGKDDPGLIAVRVAGPNAGHSAVDGGGRKWALRQVPVVAVTNMNARLVIAAGSEIDEEVLASEVSTLEDYGIPVRDRLWIDGEATVIEAADKSEEEELVAGIGSTGKGIGSARARRAMRSAPLWRHGLDEDDGWLGRTADTAAELRSWMADGRNVVIEGTQGYGLGTHAGHYPQCTSSDCRVIDFLSMVGVSPWAPDVEMNPWVVLRTYPIRVAGPSGPMLNETSWEQLGKDTGGYIKPEKTTVTQKIRRVGGWDPALAKRAVEENGGGVVQVALTFFDYWFPQLAGKTDPMLLNKEQVRRIQEIECDIGASVKLLGTGPNSVIDLRGGR